MNLDPKIFRNYDIRGIYPKSINKEVVDLLVTTVVRSLKKNSQFRKPKIVIGHDARLSSPELYAAALQAAKKSGAKVIPVGFSTTPMLYYLTLRKRQSGGLMITASHNPPEWNGLKIILGNGEALSGKAVRDLIPVQ